MTLMGIKVIHTARAYPVERRQLPSKKRREMQRLAEVGATVLVNFITAVAYHFCPSLPAAFTQPGAPTLADLCSYGSGDVFN